MLTITDYNYNYDIDNSLDTQNESWHEEVVVLMEDPRRTHLHIGSRFLSTATAQNTPCCCDVGIENKA